MTPAPLCHLLDRNHVDAIQHVKELLKMLRSEESNETYWFLTLQEPGDETQHTPIQKSMLEELIAL